MKPNDPKDDLHRYLRAAREAVVWKLDGLSEYDIRRPLTPTGTNLLGLVKHLAGVELGYFGPTFGRPHGESLPWDEEGSEPNADMWATADESREDVLGLYHRAWAHADATIAALPLDAMGRVAWWGENGDVTLQRVMLHMTAETNRHAGHADIVRELIDGKVGMRKGNSNMDGGDEPWYQEYRDRLEASAKEAEARHGSR
ncbi:DinB family protein [Streptomyces lavendulae]|uniref:DinB family protein n=1 Tax=Streptomyces lavendulae TaxID=1914 RepID=UPI0025539B7A|nr:DinB family protein [Streptomyces lavendulae]